ncbi:MAG: indole-3-glycerol phosphate synthase TrpC [Fibrobacteria bacterium]|nr:indole-3-glycerol phosphate synthase TrpC [Fibrobacteria bacterium]
METILEKIVADRQKDLAAQKEKLPFKELEKQAIASPFPAQSFLKAIHTPDRPRVNIIAEVKKASPSKGVICEDFHPLEIAKNYEQSGASAVSVLTEERYFMGSLNYLAAITKEVSIPAIRKDFIIDKYQILEARLVGASAFLLIVDCLTPEQLKEFISYGQSLNLHALVECHRGDEVDTALHCGAEIIGVNNRNLRTFETSLETTFNLRKQIPESIPMVSESGIKTVDDIKRLADNNISAALVGETLMRNPAKLRELIL